jgi:alpha-D-xyloside xylohydrolase
MTAVVDKKTGLVSFLDASGKTLLQQSAWTFSPAQNPARDGLNVGASFHRFPGEHFYGGGVVNELRQPTAHLELSNGNTRIRIPILYSNLGYSIFWDNASRGDLNLTPDQVSWHGSAGDLADYYVMAGPTADQAVAEYRHLTGAAPLFPKWAYGFWFSRNKFDNQQQILDAAKKFRDEQVPIDVLVQDYFYWKPSSGAENWTDWGSHHYVEDRYPDVKGMINTLHTEDHIHFMGVIWAKFDPDTDHGKELAAAHALYAPLGDGFGAPLQYYNPFDKTAREIYGRQVMDSLLSLGQDAFWMDGAEPEVDMNRYAALDSDGTPISRIMDAFPLMHTTAVYDAQRAATSDKRVFLLPRSSWAGEQRNAAANWTGDIHQEWKVLAWQIEGLQNYSIAGLPYITTDVGGYSADDAPGESDRELFLRWFEWGTFCPIYRVHGVARPFPWEYGPEGEAIIKKFDLLRYRLMPYIYTEGARITQSSGTLMRPLVMDFQDDAKALDTWDEFMFGPAILVCPVYKNHADEVDTLDQWADKDGKTGGVTATFLTTGNETGARMDLKQTVTGFHFADLTPEQKNAKKVRIEGAYTPDQDGKYKLVLGSYDHQQILTVDGQPVTPDVPGGNEVFTEFPLTGKAGTPLHLALETSDRRPILRITRVPTGPQHRDVYLPGKGDWYDFWSGERTTGGQTLNVETPIDNIPLFVRAGSILPMGPEIQYADESPAAPIELRVYRGVNGVYSLYEDEGNNYDYEKGAFAHIPITWNETAQTLTIGAREGSFPGMIAQRTFHVVWVGPGHGTGEDVTAKDDADVSYDGHAVTVAAPPASGR